MITAASTSSIALGTAAASNSLNFKFLGFSVISAGVTSSPSLIFINPLAANNFNALASFDVSFGTAIVAPS